ncbi:hydroxymethylglutaryl-CoA synthase family protein [Flavobacterium silvaticum]|uniref:Hydroxymethylglutaryl-CoA synthase n=1 Tax=Flavobacterium silvaticum TaxID=1852020 RepID=A0A972FU55_9FLAO|nr:hydroxymethylglutaryl-CoA synthase [Flavobacterium silvaticum]NMH27650.1 hydroxymethylglutaryl-CoA synthase [Flavobacterium silvaticum]
MKIGIDAIAFDVSKIHLPIKTLAEARHIEADKLEKGLGLKKMTLPDAHQDTVVFGANALTRLIKDNAIDLSQVCRIYIGTESGLDNSKPVGSYITGLIEQKFGENTLGHCDTVDFTFACIGAVDAMQNCIDFIRLNPNKKAIVVATDIAKYDLGSTGEYTQGAGAVALLLSQNPRIISFDTNWATSHKSVFDFFKPYRTISKFMITGNDDNYPWFGNLEGEIEIHKDQPVFDGQYSNECYIDRTNEAYAAFKKVSADKIPLDNWFNIIMHLPYAFQGRRMLAGLYAKEFGIEASDAAAVKEIAKSEGYKKFVSDKLAPAESASSLIGNLYTGSIFMGFLSAICEYSDNNIEIAGQKFGFLAYGSGSKSKVFEGTIESEWKTALSPVDLFGTLAKSHAISFEEYEGLHTKMKHNSVLEPKNEWVLDRIEHEKPNLEGARYYQWID